MKCTNVRASMTFINIDMMTTTFNEQKNSALQRSFNYNKIDIFFFIDDNNIETQSTRDAEISFSCISFFFSFLSLTHP